MSKSNQIQLSDHFTTGRLLKFTASPIIMMIFTSIYTIVDGFFVSNCAGKTAFTALNLIYPYIQMLGCLGFMIGTGGSALVAMTLGMGDEKRANRLFSMLAVATVGIGAIFSAIGLALLRPVALLLGATPELLPSCLLYGRILLTFQTAFMLQYLFQSFFIAAEKPKLGLFFTVAAGVTNMVLDFVLVGVAGLGLAGAASATVISQMVGGVAPIFYFAKRRPGCRLYFTKPLFSLRELFKACTNGISELMTNISMSLVGALYNMQLLKLFGADGVAAYGVLMYVGFVFAAVFIGYSQGTAPIVSYHFGADNKDELKNLLRKSAGIIAVAGVAMLTSSELLAEPLAKIFVGYDAGLLALTTHGMKLYCISFILSGFNIFGSAFFTALNNGAVSAAISFLRTLLFQVVSILTLPLIIGVDGIWLAVVAAEAMALVCTGGFVVRGRKRYGYLYIKKRARKRPLRLSKKVCSPLGPLCEGAPPAGGGGENCTAARNISGYGKVLSLRPFGAPPSQREVFRHAERARKRPLFCVSKASPSGLRPQARVEAQPPEAALSAETEAAARRRLMRAESAIAHR